MKGQNRAILSQESFLEAKTDGGLASLSGTSVMAGQRAMGCAKRNPHGGHHPGGHGVHGTSQSSRVGKTLSRTADS